MVVLSINMFLGTVLIDDRDMGSGNRCNRSQKGNDICPLDEWNQSHSLFNQFLFFNCSSEVLIIRIILIVFLR